MNIWWYQTTKKIKTPLTVAFWRWLETYNYSTVGFKKLLRGTQPSLGPNAVRVSCNILQGLPVSSIFQLPGSTQPPPSWSAVKRIRRALQRRTDLALRNAAVWMRRWVLTSKKCTDPNLLGLSFGFFWCFLLKSRFIKHSSWMALGPGASIDPPK